MKLKVYTPDKLPAKDKGKPVIYVNLITGRFRIHVKIQERLGLSVGDKLIFAQDEDNPSEWFVAKSNNEEGFELKRYAHMNGKENTILFNNTTLVKTIFASAEFEGESGRLVVGTESTKVGELLYYPLITASLHKFKI